MARRHAPIRRPRRRGIGRVFEHRFLVVPADVPGEHLQLVPDAGPVPGGDGPRARRLRRHVEPTTPSAACRTSRSSPRACWSRTAMQAALVRGDVPDHGRPRLEPRSSTRCTRRRSRAATSRSATSLWIAARLLLDLDGLHGRHRPVRRRAVAARSCSRSRSRSLTGLAFATPIAAFSATQRTPDRFAAIFRFGITPLFLFSGTFFPVERLPPFLQPLAWLTPLYHGVVLARGLSLGHDRRRAHARARRSSTSASCSASSSSGRASRSGPSSAKLVRG